MGMDLSIKRKPDGFIGSQSDDTLVRHGHAVRAFVPRRRRWSDRVLGTAQSAYFGSV